MNRALEQPPILSGPAAQQAQLLRDYLVRMVRQLQTLGDAGALEAAVRRSIEASAGKTREAAAGDARRRALELKSLIVKTADEVVALMDRELASLSGVYVAQSDFGVYAETTLRTIEDTARQTVESFQYDARLDAANAALGTLEQYVTSLNGQIRRGVIEDPATHEDVLGIAISENLSFTGQTEDENGVSYYRIAPGQTFGLYTSRGWQFWINGLRAAWLDAVDGKLHVANASIEESLQLGGNWVFTTTGGLGIRYIGGT